jgi:catechol 2,3-dioxygenase-like lactoylglutathione lyase family enzyme
MNGIHHVIISVNRFDRARVFYANLLPRLGYGASWEYPDADRPSVGWLGPGGSFWIKAADRRYAADTFSKDRVGLCEVAFQAHDRALVDALGRDVPLWGGTILDAPREYPEYAPGYYAVFFTDPDGIKLEAVHLPGADATGS